MQQFFYKVGTNIKYKKMFVVKAYAFYNKHSKLHELFYHITPKIQHFQCMFLCFYALLPIFAYFYKFFHVFFIHYAQQNARIILHCILGFLFCNSDLFRKRKYMPSILRIIRHITYQFLPSIFPFKTDYTIFCRQQFSICHAFLKWYKNATF